MRRWTSQARDWPWPTFVVNIIAALMLGYFSTRLLERLPASNYRRPLLGTGLCGGLSTFSTMQVETVRLLEAGAAGGSRRVHRGQSYVRTGGRASRHRTGPPGGGTAVNALVWAGVVVASGAGAVLRFLLDGAVSRRVPGSMPYGTLLVNLTGAFALGLLAGLAVSRDVELVLGAGVIGAYTTFSTWMFETQRLIEERQFVLAMTNLSFSVVAGLATAAAGLWLGGGL